MKEQEIKQKYYFQSLAAITLAIRQDLPKGSWPFLIFCNDCYWSVLCNSTSAISITQRHHYSFTLEQHLHALLKVRHCQSWSLQSQNSMQALHWTTYNLTWQDRQKKYNINHRNKYLLQGHIAGWWQREQRFSTLKSLAPTDWKLMSL